MKTKELRDKLHFLDSLKSVEIKDQNEIEEGVWFVLAYLQSDIDNAIHDLYIPFIVLENEDFILTPWDWHMSFEGFTLDQIEDIVWRVDNTEKRAIMFNGVPRLFV